MNTRFHYRYRDSSNYKFFYNVIVKGEFIVEQIMPYMDRGECFVPSEVGLKNLQPEPMTTRDHIWHEIDLIEFTENDPTLDLNATDLVINFKKAHEKEWNLLEVFKRYELI